MRHGYASILDRWSNVDVYRALQLKFGWTEEQVKQLDEATKDEGTDLRKYAVSKSKMDGYTQEGTHAHHSDFRAVREIHGASLTYTSVPFRNPSSQDQSQQQRQRTWQSLLSDNKVA